MKNKKDIKDIAITTIICLAMLIWVYVSLVYPAIKCEDTLVRGVWKMECIDLEKR